jgi:hypothetical protein
MKENMQTYWKKWIDKTSRQLSFSNFTALSAQRIEWGVLGITRQYYTFHKNNITSKTVAGIWALDNVPEKFHKILKEAVNIRNGKKSLYSSKFKRRRDAIEYMTYIYKESENGFIKIPNKQI